MLDNVIDATPRSLAPAALSELRAALGPACDDDPLVLEGYRRDESAMVEAGTPGAVVLARSAADVAATLRVAAAHRVPVVARGAGSGLSGGANAVDGCVVLSLERMARVLDIDDINLTAVVEPGVVNAQLKAMVAERGLQYAPDPSSYELSTMGGNLATNAGGLCCVKYGVTRDSVLGVEVVLAGGERVQLGRRTLKGVAGYDLTSLFVGSEGTLGVITAATLRLRPIPPPPATVLAFFPTLREAADAVVRIRRRLVPSMLELMDGVTVAAVERWRALGLDTGAAALLLMQTDSGGESGAAEARWMEDACREAGASDAMLTADPAESAMLVTARRLALPALQRLGTVLLDDVAVPVAAIPELVGEVQAVAGRRGVVVGTFGHAGDGNMHPSVVYDASSAAAVQAAREAFDDIVHAALRLGGTITGEHGVGALKRDLLAAELGDGALALHRAVKAALDPLGILNPGKLLPDPRR